MTSGGLNDKTRDKVGAFLDGFDGDVMKAAHALRDYANELRGSQVSQPKEQNPSTGKVLLSVKDIRKTYKLGRQKIEVLRGIDLTVHEGEFVAITGASGSGKSTLLQLIGGLDKPTSGMVQFGDTNIAKLSDRRLSEFRRQTVGFVFQFFYLQPFLRLERNLEVPGMFARTKRKQRKQRTAELAKQVGLSDRLKHYPRELSGGQLQRAAIARALFNQPKVILADEPTGNLDTKNSKAIIDLFETIRRELGTAIVIVTHDPVVAARADRQIVLQDGELI